MTPQGFTLFDTAIGRCAVVWSERGVVGALLPERDDAAMRARLGRRYPGAREAAPPDQVARAIGGIVALIAGERRDLTDIVLDLEGVPEFDRCVYAVARTIGPGATLTYGAIAAQLGEPDARRRRGDGPEPLPHHCSVPSRGGGRRQDRQLLGARRRRHQAPTARHRGRTDGGRADAIRSPRRAGLRRQARRKNEPSRRIAKRPANAQIPCYFPCYRSSRITAGPAPASCQAIARPTARARRRRPPAPAAPNTRPS